MTHSNQYHVPVQVDKITSDLIQFARDKVAELYELHCFESASEHLEFIDSLLADNQYLFPVAESVAGGVRGTNQTQRESKAANQRPTSNLLPAETNPVIYLHQISSLGE
jgi:hypothetical protein